MLLVLTLLVGHQERHLD